MNTSYQGNKSRSMSLYSKPHPSDFDIPRPSSQISRGGRERLTSEPVDKDIDFFPNDSLSKSKDPKFSASKFSVDDEMGTAGGQQSPSNYVPMKTRDQWAPGPYPSDPKPIRYHKRPFHPQPRPIGPVKAHKFWVEWWDQGDNKVKKRDYALRCGISKRDVANHWALTLLQLNFDIQVLDSMLFYMMEVDREKVAEKRADIELLMRELGVDIEYARADAESEQDPVRKREFEVKVKQYNDIYMHFLVEWDRYNPDKYMNRCGEIRHLVNMYRDAVAGKKGWIYKETGPPSKFIDPAVLFMCNLLEDEETVYSGQQSRFQVKLPKK